MKKIILYIFPLLFAACSGQQNKNDSKESWSGGEQDTTKNTCFCDLDSNLNLISDAVRDSGMRQWNRKIAALYPGIPLANLPKGFQISVTDMLTLANLLNKKENPPIANMMGYFMFKSTGAADSGMVSIVFVPHYKDTSFHTCPDCKKNGIGSQKGQSINVDLTKPCPPACENQ